MSETLTPKLNYLVEVLELFIKKCDFEIRCFDKRDVEKIKKTYDETIDNCIGALHERINEAEDIREKFDDYFNEYGSSDSEEEQKPKKDSD